MSCDRVAKYVAGQLQGAAFIAFEGASAPESCIRPGCTAPLVKGKQNCGAGHDQNLTPTDRMSAYAVLRNTEAGIEDRAQAAEILVLQTFQAVQEMQADQAAVAETGQYYMGEGVLAAMIEELRGEMRVLEEIDATRAQQVREERGLPDYYGWESPEHFSKEEAAVTDGCKLFVVVESKEEDREQRVYRANREGWYTIYLPMERNHIPFSIADLAADVGAPPPECSGHAAQLLRTVGRPMSSVPGALGLSGLSTWVRAREVPAHARYLDEQRPNPWTEGEWYPAQLPNGSPVEIRRSSGRGRSKGQEFLHVRRETPQYIVDPETGDREVFGSAYEYIRINLGTGEAARVRN